MLVTHKSKSETSSNNPLNKRTSVFRQLRTFVAKTSIVLALAALLCSALPAKTNAGLTARPQEIRRIEFRWALDLERLATSRNSVRIWPKQRTKSIPVPHVPLPGTGHPCIAGLASDCFSSQLPVSLFLASSAGHPINASPAAAVVGPEAVGLEAPNCRLPNQAAAADDLRVCGGPASDSQTYRFHRLPPWNPRMLLSHVCFLQFQARPASLISDAWAGRQV
jgi:hypothetical protein